MPDNAWAAAEAERYRGHISLCEFDISGQQAIRHAHVAVVGAGGLASPLLLYLAAAGVGRITIIDADRVELSNLQRQVMHSNDQLGALKVDSACRAAARLNPQVELIPVAEMLSDENAQRLIAQADVVADCTDSFASRLMISDLCRSMGKTLCVATVARFSGQVFTQQGDSAGFADIFGDMPPVGDNASCAEQGILNAVVGVAGSLQAAEVLKAITRAGDLLTNRLLSFDALTMTFSSYDLTRG